MPDDNKRGNAATGVLVLSLASSGLTGLGFCQMGWPWAFGVLLGFFGTLFLLAFLFAFAE